MGFPYDELDWNVVDGAMFMGWGTSLTFFYSLIAIVVGIAFLLYGQMIESDKYDKVKK